MEMVNPLAAFREGYDTTQGLFDARTRRQAGNALAMGDYRSGANALLGGGMLDEGTSLLQYDQRNRMAQAEALKAQEDAAKAAQAQGLKTMLNGAQSLRQLSPEQRSAAWQGQVRPLLQQQGVPDDLLARFDQSGFTDGELDPFITTLGGELQKPEWQVVSLGNGGVAAYDKQSGTLNVLREPVITPDVPTGYRATADGRGLEYIPGGPADPRQAGTLASSRRAPKKGGGSRVSGGGASPRDYGSDPSGPRW